MTDNRRNLETDNTMPIRIPAPPKDLNGPEAQEYLMRVFEGVLKRQHKALLLLSKEG